MVKCKVESLKFRGLCLWALLLFSPLTFAQREASDVRKGNREYKSENFSGAEVDYRRALQTNKDSYEAHYNLGDALYRQEKYADALEAYETAARSLDKKEEKTRYSKVMHNIGNCHFAAQQYDKAVSAYQESLRANPKDNESRAMNLSERFFILLPPYAGQPAASRTASPLLATWTASALTSMWAVLP